MHSKHRNVLFAFRLPGLARHLAARTRCKQRQRAFPSSFLIPGTQTWLRIGYVKLDLLDDFGKNLGDFIS
jgi:hypothetical protein